MNPEPLQLKKLDRYLERYESKREQHRVRKANLTMFFEHINKNPDTYLKDIRNLDNKDKNKITDEYEKDIENYVIFLSDNNYAPNSIRSKIATIKNFLRYNKIELEQYIWNDLKTLLNGNDTIIKDRIPTHEELREILSNGNSFDKALFLTLLSSGIRPIELLDITLDDLYLDEEPPKIHIQTRNTISKKRRAYIYISHEAKDSIDIWLKQRPKHIRNVNKKLKKINDTKEKILFNIKENSNKLFPIHKTSVNRRWNKLLEKSDLNEKDKSSHFDNRYILHLYSLRSFFRVNFGHPDISEILMGHKQLIRLYAKYPEEQIKKIYLDKEKNLLIFTDTRQLEQTINKKLGEKDKETQQLRAELQELKSIIMSYSFKEKDQHIYFDKNTNEEHILVKGKMINISKLLKETTD